MSSDDRFSLIHIYFKGRQGHINSMERTVYSIERRGYVHILFFSTVIAENARKTLAERLWAGAGEKKLTRDRRQYRS